MNACLHKNENDLTIRDKNEPSCSFYFGSSNHENNAFLDDVNEWKNKFESLSLHYETCERNNFEKEICSLKNKMKELENVISYLKNDEYDCLISPNAMLVEKIML